MAGYIDLILATTDPVNALLLGGIYLRMKALTGRVTRLENAYIDGPPNGSEAAGEA
jgi:hypothetical protein